MDAMPLIPAVAAGSLSPLGASWDGSGVNFAVFSAHADRVDLCLFDPSGTTETSRQPLISRADGIWRGYVAGLAPGQLYGYRAAGPYQPAQGHRFNPNKLLIDPYARLLSGAVIQDDALYGFQRGAVRGPLSYDRRDSAPFVPKSVVPTPPGPRAEDHRPRRSWHETLIYEAHVKGLTQLHPDVPPALRGTYAALGHRAIVAHLVRLGVTAIELLPIQSFLDDRPLTDRGLVNYWGYQTLGYFTPEPRYLGETGPVGLKQAIRALHEAGIEVILDVVYNHTCEGDSEGPTLSFRGLDNASYYKGQPGDRGRLWDVTGCGNTLDLGQQRVRQLVVDSLRYWADEYQVDGFRFDLASALGRETYDFSAHAAFFAAIADDPVLSGLKMISEPWDIGPGGYQVGGFPPGWSDWNDQIRDTVRTFWRGDRGRLARLTQGLSGSKEIFLGGGRGPRASINFVTCHDGFTLRDLVSYERKHNERNGEQNRDGSDGNNSANNGQEGDTQDAAILAVRSRQVRNMLATIFLSQGVPMLLAGDELFRTQGGNNNAYCQDDATSWVDWEAGRALDPDLTEFVANLSAVRRGFAGLRRQDYLTGTVLDGNGLKDVYWLAPSGEELAGNDWGDESRQAVAVQLGNDASDGRRILYLINAATDPATFHLRADFPSRAWTIAFTTTTPDGCPPADASSFGPGGTFVAEPRSVVLFQHTD